MTKVDVRDETRRSATMRREIERLLKEVTGPLKAITDLKLPAVTVRLVTPVAWRAEVRGYGERQPQHTAATLPGKPTTSDHWHGYAWTWEQRPGITLTTADGMPQTLVVPRALQLTITRSPRGLHRFLAQEATRQAQIHRSRGAAAPTAPWAPHHRQVHTLVTGHAIWAQRGISAAVHDTPMTVTTARSSLLSLRHAYFRARNTHLPVHEPTEEQLRTIEAAVFFVERTVDRIGVDLWNRTVWRNLTRAPTDEQLRDPDAWLRAVGR